MSINNKDKKKLRNITTNITTKIEESKRRKIKEKKRIIQKLYKRIIYIKEIYKKNKYIKENNYK